jgi:hypothetical protein
MLVSTSDASYKPHPLFEAPCSRISKYGAREFGSQSETDPIDGQIEIVTGSVLSPEFRFFLRRWARSRQTRLGIEAVFRRKSYAPASSEVIS